MKRTDDKRLKQIMPEKNILFNEFEMKIGNHPIILFTDWFGDLYYLKTRSVYDGQGFKKDKTEFEIEIPVSAMKKETLLVKDFYLDTARIYKIKEQEFDLIYNNERIPLVSHLDWEYGKTVFKEVLKNFEKQPPKISIIEVFLNDELGKFNSFTIYSHEEILKQEENKLKTQDKWNEEIVIKKATILENSKTPYAQNFLEDVKNWTYEEFFEYQDALFQFRQKWKNEEKWLETHFGDNEFENFSTYFAVEKDIFRSHLEQILLNIEDETTKKNYVFQIREIELNLPKELEEEYKNIFFQVLTDKEIAFNYLEYMVESLKKEDINDIKRALEVLSGNYDEIGDNIEKNETDKQEEPEAEALVMKM
ncbi:Mbov_0400 family ICE element protein [Mycoplasma procyoni]|uniref:Mbov_0400 family ICE element protein n=1 Tax=Mycoplasma procyoni TaxID=568784 RepID=UPI00197BFED7|nr:hypothetical protein [Mycoplasma procyoni]MBN3534668.1 hypothetical protein [Mycoplasma procyoni]